MRCGQRGGIERALSALIAALLVGVVLLLVLVAFADGARAAGTATARDPIATHSETPEAPDATPTPSLTPDAEQLRRQLIDAQNEKARIDHELNVNPDIENGSQPSPTPIPYETATPEPTATPPLDTRLRAQVETLKQQWQQLGQRQQQAEAQLDAIKAERLRIEGAVREIGKGLGGGAEP